jgi:hypothetical protein
MTLGRHLSERYRITAESDSPASQPIVIAQTARRLLTLILAPLVPPVTLIGTGHVGTEGGTVLMVGTFDTETPIHGRFGTCPLNLALTAYADAPVGDGESVGARGSRRIGRGRRSLG